MTELVQVADRVRRATDYTEVFGVCAGKTDQDINRHIRHTYRRLARVVHPDLYTRAAERTVAEDAFRYLNQLHMDAIKAVDENRYGQPLRLAVIRTRHASHEIIRTSGRGDLCTTYLARTTMSTERSSFCKIAYRPVDKDLLTAEARALKRLRSDKANPKWVAFIPELLDSFVYAEAGKPRRQANVITRLEGFYDLESVRQAFSGKLGVLHMIWIWRRLLVALGHAHDNKVVHGAVLPRHVMILPEQHGLVLVDWCYASIADDTQPPIRAIVDAYKDWYPAEVFAKTTPSPATDIVMAARCMIWLIGGNPLTAVMPMDIPRPLRAFLRGCLQTSIQARTNDAWRLLKEFDELLEQMGSPYYPRRFRPFTMSSGVV